MGAIDPFENPREFFAGVPNADLLAEVDVLAAEGNHAAENLVLDEIARRFLARAEARRAKQEQMALLAAWQPPAGHPGH